MNKSKLILLTSCFLLFGFVAAAYFVGEKLNRNELVFITSLYSLVMAAAIWQLYQIIQMVGTLEYALTGSYSESALYIPPAICLIGWASSVWFMFRSSIVRSTDA